MSLVDPAYRTIGPGGPEIGPLAFGCWRFTHDDLNRAGEVLEAALDLGMNLVDTADVYGLDWGGAGFGANEELLGQVLARAPELRDRMVLATKGGIVPPIPYDSGAIAESCEASLRRLGVDHVDLYQIHRPDLYTHPAALAEALLDLRERGLIGAIGVSNHTVDQHRALEAHLGEALATTQPEFSITHLDPITDGVLDHAMAVGTTPLAWSPLGGGALATGDGLRPELREVMDRLAEREQVDRATIALAFVLAHPSRPVAILGSQDPGRLEGSTRALRVTLTRDDCYDLIEASTGEPLP